MARLLFLCLILLGSCSSLQKWAVRRSSPVFDKAADQLTKEDSWAFFQHSAPANLKFIEMVYLTDPDNLNLLPAVIKAYAGYAFAVPESMALHHELKGDNETYPKEQAIRFYTRALDYGTFFLEKRGLSKNDLLNLEEEKLTKKLKDEIDEDDLVALLYFAQSWGSLINLQKDNVALVSQVPRVKILFDHVCGMNPKIEHNICEIFFAQYEASRPRMLGGNPEKARELYLKAIADHPQHLLMRLSYIQYSLIPAMDEEAYNKEAEILRKEFADWESMKRDNLEDESPYKKHRELNLYNAIAKKRFEIIELNKKKIF